MGLFKKKQPDHSTYSEDFNAARKMTEENLNALDKSVHKELEKWDKTKTSVDMVRNLLRNQMQNDPKIKNKAQEILDSFETLFHAIKTVAKRIIDNAKTNPNPTESIKSGNTLEQKLLDLKARANELIDKSYDTYKLKADVNLEDALNDYTDTVMEHVGRWGNATVSMINTANVLKNYQPNFPLKAKTTADEYLKTAITLQEASLNDRKGKQFFTQFDFDEGNKLAKKMHDLCVRMIELLKNNGVEALVYPDGARYEGEVKNGHPNGRGMVAYADGNTYAGSLRNGKRHGQGVLTIKGGQVLDGEWKDDEFIKAKK